MGSLRRPKSSAPSRSCLLDEVALTAAPRGPRLTAAREFEAAGIRVQYVPLDAQGGYRYQWVGASHYLALHDLQLADGEVFADGAAVVRRKDLRGLMTFAPAGCRVWGWSVPRSAGHSFTALYLNPRNMEEALAQRLHDISAQAHVYFANSALRATLEKMQWALARSTSADSMYLESLCLLAVLELCVVQKERLVAAGQRAGRLTRSHEQRIAQFIETNLGKDIGLNELAQVAGLSRFHFLRAFKRTTDETPYQYLLRRRIQRAQSLLRESKAAVAEIALAVGFKDSTQFIRAFRKIVGVTPGAYRE
jgi:AraC family transcriptional regulator